MSSKLTVPLLTAGKDYLQYKAEVELWQAVTQAVPDKQGVWLALNLPDNHPDALKEKVMGPALGSAKLQSPTGAVELLKYLDTL